MAGFASSLVRHAWRVYLFSLSRQRKRQMEAHLLWIAKRWFATAMQLLVRHGDTRGCAEGRQLSRCRIDALIVRLRMADCSNPFGASMAKQ
jgi:hypothetical protein